MKKTLQEIVQEAEALASENGGILSAPSFRPPHIQRAILKHPEAFLHIPTSGPSLRKLIKTRERRQRAKARG